MIGQKLYNMPVSFFFMYFFPLTLFLFSIFLFRLTCPTLKSTPTLHPWLRLRRWAGAARDSVAAVSFYDVKRTVHLDLSPPDPPRARAGGFPVRADGSDWETCSAPHPVMSFNQHYSPFSGFIQDSYRVIKVDELGECATLFITNYLEKRTMGPVWKTFGHFYWMDHLDLIRDHGRNRRRSQGNQLIFLAPKHTVMVVFNLWAPHDTHSNTSLTYTYKWILSFSLFVLLWDWIFLKHDYLPSLAFFKICLYLEIYSAEGVWVTVKRQGQI